MDRIIYKWKIKKVINRVAELVQWLMWSLINAEEHWSSIPAYAKHFQEVLQFRSVRMKKVELTGLFMLFLHISICKYVEKA